MTSFLLLSELVYQIVEAKLHKNYPQECSLQFYPPASFSPTITIKQSTDTAYLLSRTALDIAASKISDEKKGPKCLPQTLSFEERVKLTKDYHLANFAQAMVSLSHTKNFGAAVVGIDDNTRNNKNKGIGIDIEVATRLVKSEIIQQIRHPQDDFLKITQTSDFSSNLAIWCLKEACFKALAAKNAEVKFMSEIWLAYPHFGYAPKLAHAVHNSALTDTRGICQVQCIKAFTQPLVLALAAIEF